MHSQDHQVLSTVLQWQGQGQRSALVTLARTWGSAPRAPGAWLAVRADGVMVGSVSGGCVEDDLLERLRSGGLEQVKPFVLTYGAGPDDAERFGLPCGGTLELVVEPRPDSAQLLELARRLGAGQLVRRHIDLNSGSTALAEAAYGETMTWDGQQLSTLHGPRRRLLIIGAGQISHYLAGMAPALDFAVSVCDPREEIRAGWSGVEVAWIDAMPDDAVLAMAPDPHSAIVALTHDPKLDDMALLEALKTPAFYVGAIGSAANNARRRQRLGEHFDLSPEELGRLHGPVGLPIGSHTPPEIAIAILAEMVAVSRGAVLERSNPPVAAAKLSRGDTASPLGTAAR